MRLEQAAFVALVLGSACAREAAHRPGAPPAATSATASDPAGLEADLRVASLHVPRIQELRATIVLVNRGLQPRRVYVLFMEAGNLTLEVEAASGQRVPGMSPPVPVQDDGVTGWTTLAAGQSLTFASDAGIGIDVPAGRYRVRFAGVPADPAAGALRTDWIAFEVDH